MSECKHWNAIWNEGCEYYECGDCSKYNLLIPKMVDNLHARIAQLEAENANLKQYVCDGTPFQSDDYTRGEDSATRVFCALVMKILNGEDSGTGVNNEPWASVRKGVLSLVAENARKDDRIAALRKAGHRRCTPDNCDFDGDDCPATRQALEGGE